MAYVPKGVYLELIEEHRSYRDENRGLKCAECDNSIKNGYDWKGQILGIECFKKIAIPELTDAWVEEKKWETYEEVMKDYFLVETLKNKDLKRIKNQFKLDFIPSVIKFFETRGVITESQRDIVLGTGEWNGYGYDHGLFNNKDWDYLKSLRIKFGFEKKEE